MKKLSSSLFIFLLSIMGLGTMAHASLYFPHVDCNAPWDTEICIINNGTSQVSGTLNGMSDNGQKVSSLTVSLGPGARKQVNVDSEMTNADQIGYMIFDTLSIDVVGYTKFYSPGSYSVAVPAVSTVNSGTIYIPHIASDGTWWSGVSLVNTTSSDKQITIRFNNQVEKQINLSAGHHQAFTVSGLFGNTPQPQLQSATIENAGGVIGLELFGGANQLSGLVLSGNLDNQLFYPHVANDANWWTGVVAYNPSNADNQLTIGAYDELGNGLGTQSITLGPLGKFIGTVDQLNLPANTQWFSIQAQSPIIGFELFGTKDGNTVDGYSVVDLATRSGSFSKVESNGWTGIAFVNTESSPATITLTAYGDNGAGITSIQYTLNGYAKYVGLVEDLFQGANIDNASFIRFDSDREIVGFQLNGDTTGAMLDALPAIFADTVQGAMNSALGLLSYSDSLGTLQEEMGNILSAALGTSMTCPSVSLTPKLVNINNLPENMTVTVDYGDGCTTVQGSEMSGSATISISGLSMSDTALSLTFSASFSDLTRDETLTIGGSVSGSVQLALDSSGNVSTGTISLTFDNLTAGNNTVSGQVDVQLNDISLSGDTFGSMTVSMTNLVAGPYTVTTGTVTVTSTGTDQYQVDVDLTTNEGPVDITLNITTTEDGSMQVSTTDPGNVAGYTITMANTLMNIDVCEDYPIGGVVTIAGGGETSTFTFDSSCDGTYNYTSSN